MKRLFALLLFFMLTLPVSTSFAADTIKRTAIIADKSSTITEVSDFHFEASEALNNQVLELPDDKILIETKGIVIGISLERVISIERKGKTDDVTVTYLNNGQKTVISGDVYSVGYYTGKSDFGDFKLWEPDLKRLTIKEDTSVTYDKSPVSYDTTIVFSDGTSLPVANLKRFNYYCSGEGYAIGCASRYFHTADFEFKKGNSVRKLSFTNIKSLEFKNVKKSEESFTIKGAVSITLKDGKSEDGIIADSFQGITGTCDKGEFFVEPIYIKKIEFNSEGISH